MKLEFSDSQLNKLIKEVKDNPLAIGVLLTHQELVSIYEELLMKSNSNAIFLTGKDRKILIDDRWITVKILTH